MHQATKSRRRAAHWQIVVRGVEHYMDATQMGAATGCSWLSYLLQVLISLIVWPQIVVRGAERAPHYMDAVQLGAAAGEGSAAALRHISSLSDAFEVGAAACPLTDIRGPVNGARCRELTWLCGPRCWGGRASDNSLHSQV